MARFVNGPSNFLNLYAGGLVINFNNISACAWVYSLGRYGPAIGAGANGGFEFAISTVQAVLNSQNTAFIGESSPQFPYRPGWHHFIVTYVNPGNFVFYVDGKAQGSGTNGNAISTTSTAYFIGKSANPPNDNLLGYVHDLAWTKFILTPAEAFALGTGRARPYTLRPGAANYLGYWPLDGSGGASTENDYSGNGQNSPVTGSCPVMPGPPQLNPPIVIRRGTIGSAFNAVARTMRANLTYTGYPTM